MRMRYVIKMECKRAYESRSFQGVLFLGILLAVLDYLTGIKIYDPSAQITYPATVVLAWLPMNFQFAYGMIFVVLLPLMAAIPYGGSYYHDRKSGYIKNIRLKVSGRAYFCAKYLVCFGTGFIVVLLPLLVSFFLVSTYLPWLKPEPFAQQGLLQDACFMSEYFYERPVLYILFYALIMALFGGIFSVTALCVTAFAKNLFSVLVIPFAVYITSGAFLQQIGWTDISIFEMVNPLQSFTNRGNCIGIIMILCIGCTFYQFCFVEAGKDVV